MSIRHPVDLAEVQDGQHVGGLVREPIGRQRHLVLVEMAPEVPLSRREEVAGLVAFLCSPLADAIHGQNIRIDGGQLGIVD